MFQELYFHFFTKVLQAKTDLNRCTAKGTSHSWLAATCTLENLFFVDVNLLHRLFSMVVF